MEEHLKVIMVEDSTFDAELLEQRLIRIGLPVHVERVDTEEEFIRALQRGAPDLIFSDFSLPDFSGAKALEIALERAPDSPFIYVSGTIGEERAIEALHRGATDYILKGNLSRLSSVVQRALQETAMRAHQRILERERRDQEERLRRLTRTYRMLSSVSSVVLRLSNRSDLLDEVCRIVVDQGMYAVATIRLLESDGSTVKMKAYAEAKECADLAQPSRWEDFVNLHADGSAINVVVPTVFNDLSGLADFDHLTGHDLQALASLPLLVDGTAIGVLTVFSSVPGIFDEPELKILHELAANLGFALQYLQRDEAVHFLSYFDSLTGVAKRPLFSQRLAQQLLSGECSQVLVLDVQNLRGVNDSLGRYAGDLLIGEMASRLKTLMKDGDRVGNLGGATFALSLPEAYVSAEADVVPTQVSKVFARPFHLNGELLRPAIRYGIAMAPVDGESAEKLIHCAEVALDAARETNDQARHFGQVTVSSRTKSFPLEARVLGAMEREEFLLHYQPKMSLLSGRLEGFEALLRWNDPREGMVSPATFIPILERSGAIIEVGAWVIAQAARDVRDWFIGSLQPMRVAVNVSPMQLRQREFVDVVLHSLATVRSVGAGSIDIEITESMLMRDLDSSIRKLSVLREADVEVAIDDFGTGYSCLSLLGRLPVDILKIDRSFIQNVAVDSSAATLVTSIVSLARTFNMRTVAEGVETREQLQLLRSSQCDEAQGFLLSRPMPSKAISSFIEQAINHEPLVDDAGRRPIRAREAN